MGFFSFLGRVLFASIFILSAWQMFNEFGDNGGPAAKEWAPKLVVIKKFIDGIIGKSTVHIDVKTFVAACIFLQGLGGLFFVLGSSFGAYVLIYYMILTTPLKYDFYNYNLGDKEFFRLLQEFLQGAALVGALFFYLGMKNSILSFILFNNNMLLQDYLKSVVPSQLLGERGSNLVVINPGSANIRIGIAQQDSPFNVPHCIARRTSQLPKKSVQDQLLNSQVTTAQHMDRERAYDIIASLLKIRFLDEEVANDQYPQKVMFFNVSREDFRELMGRVDGFPAQNNNKKETVIPWADVFEKGKSASSAEGSSLRSGEPLTSKEGNDDGEPSSSEPKHREFICGEEALRISPSEPYCLRRPIRRGHLNISMHYPVQQVLEDMHAIWEWILIEKLNIPLSERHKYSAIIVVPETFDNREIKEVLSIVLRDLCFSTAVVHQEGLAAVFGNGLSTACVVNIGAQVTSVICIEDGVTLPTTQITLRYGGEVRMSSSLLSVFPFFNNLQSSFFGKVLYKLHETIHLLFQDISRCLLWTQRHHQTWPPIRTDALTKPIDLLMLNRLKESHCQIREGEVEAVSVVHSYEEGVPPGWHKTKLTALNVPPMGLFYPMLLVPDVYPPPPRSWFSDNEDMLEDTWDFPRRPDMSDGYYPGSSGFYPMWDNYPVFQSKPKKQDNIGLADAITKSILSTGRIDLQRKLFCSMQLIGGVALTEGLISAVEERVLHAIPSHEAIDTVEVLQSRTNPAFVPWKGGAILGILDFTRDAWIHREDWIKSGIHVRSGRKYKDSHFLQAQAMCFLNS
ncbi:hypothetical protein RD792_009976 [Penstemon davidsonii]|uniref:Actin-related protein 9 n=1 Tax=Penstemon davidsonii TaxID=160366 RepID=A0ABR0D0K0_9LAMI|nr:hypothetical protein RD792_009976 [Penstemon davidsonii]